MFSRTRDLYLADATPKQTPAVTIKLVSVLPGVPCGCLWCFKVKPSRDIGPLGLENIPCVFLKVHLHDLLAEVAPTLPPAATPFSVSSSFSHLTSIWKLSKFQGMGRQQDKQGSCFVASLFLLCSSSPPPANVQRGLERCRHFK